MLFAALLTSNTGLQAASGFLDVVGNNVANSNTTGFKTAQVTFQDLFYVGPRPGAASTPGVTPPVGTQIGSGAVIDAITGLFTQGTLNQTGQPFDLAITGQGFFAVTFPDGTTGYTRAGNFTTDANGQLVTVDGFRLADNIVVPQNASSVSVSSGGVVTAITPAGVQQLGTINLTQFQNPGGLTRVGNTTFVASPVSGAATTGAPGSVGLGTLSQGFLEQSNVELVTELVNLIIAQRAFSFNTQAIQIENEVLQATTALIQ
jgi:flagellar basal-body rod protein FlgG